MCCRKISGFHITIVLLWFQLKDYSYKNIDGLDPSSEMLNLSNDQGLYSQTYQQYFGIDSGIQEGKIISSMVQTDFCRYSVNFIIF